MTIAVSCGSCQAALRVKDAFAGKRVRCTRCGAPLEIPAPDPVAAPDDPNARMRELLDAFRGEVPRRRTSVSYRVGVLLVAAAMLLLPAVYVALIAGVAFLLYYHATANVTLLQGPPSIVRVVFGYAGPLIVGAVLLFFMVKPLFAGRARAERFRSLEFGEEPLLFALVARVARALGAPEPKRIDVDCQVNASAAFDGLFGRDLVLTIGLPLTAGLSMRQLAGVVAHELGHFSQGGGMRLSLVVRSVNAWFYRVANERDDWDEALAAWSEEGGWLSLIFLTARLCVWLTRGVLWLLMLLGHAISCFLSRQMEYDADRCEAQVAGGEAFAETLRRLEVLELVMQVLGPNLVAGRANGRLPDDLCPLIVLVAAGLSDKPLRHIEKELSKTRTGLFDTHPAYPDRLAAVRRLNAPGVFHLDGPASRLFGDFPRLTRAVTRDFYRAAFGRVRREELVPAETFLSGPEKGGPTTP